MLFYGGGECLGKAMENISLQDFLVRVRQT
jgi:hypothetical protein